MTPKKPAKKVVKAVQAWGLKCIDQVYMVRMEKSTLLPYKGSKDKIVRVEIREVKR